MSRPVRIEYHGAIHHVTSRGGGIRPQKVSRQNEVHLPWEDARKVPRERPQGVSGRQADQPRQVFRDQEDRAVFLNTLGNVVERFNWLLHSYVLMDDHYHLVVEVPDANLSRGMRQLNGAYTLYFNRRYQQHGSIFQGRFKSILFEKKKYLLPVCRHVVINPSRLSESHSYASWLWSSHRAVGGQVKAPAFLHVADILSRFGKQPKSCQRKYRQYIRQGIGLPSPLDGRSHQILLGSPAFVRAMEPILRGQTPTGLARKAPRAAPRRKSLRAIFKGVSDKPRAERNRLIRIAHLDFGYTLMAIGAHLGLHYTTVSKVVNASKAGAKP